LADHLANLNKAFELQWFWCHGGTPHQCVP
jgi:hypothetical protein